jgi:Zn-dependent protease with chaperone function
LYDGLTTVAEAVTWELTPAELVIHTAAGERRVARAVVRASTRVGQTRRTLQLPGGAQLQTDDNEAVDTLAPRVGLERLVARLEGHPLAVAAGLVVTAGGVALFFMVGLPLLAARLAAAMPAETEALLGDQVMIALDRAAFAPSELPAVRRAELERLFENFVGDVPGGARLSLEFRRLGEDEINALAVPGGRIVFTDALVNLLEHDEEFLAVLAHEVGHHSGRHALRSVLQQSVALVAVTLATGDIASATGAVAAVPAFLLHSHYSREFEREADATALRALDARGISPAWFGRIMERLSGATAAAEASFAAYADTHPTGAERIATARAAAGDREPLGALIVARAATPRAAVPVVSSYDAALLVGCWEATSSDPEEPPAWRERYRPDGTLLLWFRGEDPAADSQTGAGVVSRGHWALQGDSLVELVVDADSPPGIDNGEVARYTVQRLLGDTLQYVGEPDGDSYRASRIDCPAELAG